MAIKVKKYKDSEYSYYYMPEETDVQSRLLLRHLLGTLSFWDYELCLVDILANAHGWTIEIEE